MRYRQLDANGDYTIGLPFFFNTPAGVAQAISTRLKLWQGEWFLDSTAGTPWHQSILGRSVNPDAFIKQAILGTTGVTAIVSYASSLNRSSRTLTVSGVVATLYSQASFSVSLNVG
jgi:hypothetical protein